MLLSCETAVTDARASDTAAELETWVKSAFAGRLDGTLNLIDILSFLWFATKLKTSAHLRVVVWLDCGRLLKCLRFLLHSALFFLTLLSAASSGSSIVVKQRWIVADDVQVGLRYARRRPYQFEILDLEIPEE